MAVMTRLVFPALLLLIASGAHAEQPAPRVDYLKQVKPIFSAKCFACHGALKQESGLRLETRALMLRGGDSGGAIVPGKAEESLLIQRISAGDALRMPPETEGAALTADEIAVIRQWIDQGAEAPDEPVPANPQQHWAFQPIVRPPLPKVDNAAWVRNPIDAFLARRHAEHGLAPPVEAPRLIQLRRLYLDLIGVPPTAEEIAACQSDPSDRWYGRTVERLLHDPRHGQRWARHWMDIWRYSDWWGLGNQLRNSQKHIWHWRDWIVESLNDDTPYDEMVRLMLAADELHPNDLDKLRATGYLARNYFLFNRPKWMEETVEHVSKGFLGMTINCAKCHDHKYDAISQTDFYRLRAFFEPYHVRMDVVPGEPDLARDGIARAFDGLPEEPTYRYVRGDAENPDKSQVIQPGVPELLAFDELEIQPVELPAEAWQPHLRPWVAEAYLGAAEQELATAERDLEQASDTLAAARRMEAEAAAQQSQAPAADSDAGSLIVAEDFRQLDENRWQRFGGDWVHEPGALQQKKDGPTRSVLRLTALPPRDFEATLRFKILGGSKYRSVGIAFDADKGNPAIDGRADHHEQLVYVSAYSAGPKVQMAYRAGGKWHYPPAPAMRPLPIELNRQYTLRLRVRGPLINVALNGKPVLACPTPLARRDGFLQLLTFDALAEFHELQVGKLPKSTPLREPDGEPVAGSNHELDLAGAEAAHQVAEAAVAAARAELIGVKQRAAALQGGDDGKSAKRQAAVKAERRAAVMKARHAVAVAEQKLLQATEDKKDEADKALKSAQAALAKAESAAEAEVKPTDTFTPLVGARWSATRFGNSGRDDPEVTFPAYSTGRRAALANWITDRRNPLTARVAANHIWTRHMGRPLVPSVFDFGRNGTPPTHPELLDWLAAELIDSGWSMKHLHRVIVHCAAYRMSSASASEANVAADPDNRYWWRRSPQRLESQAVRDSILSLAGTLDASLGGPPVPQDQQAASRRRSLYFFHSNNQRNLFLTTFDEALVKECYRRQQSIVPQQALALTNSALVLDASGRIAQRLSQDTAGEAEFVQKAFALVLGMRAGEAELAASRQALASWRKLPGGSPQRARANFIWALINHNDFVTLR